MPPLRVPRSFRNLLFAAAVSVASVGLICGPAVAQAPPGAIAWTPTETANAKLAETFMKGFGAQVPSADALADMLSDDVVLSFSEKDPPIVGKPAALAALKGILPPGRRYRIDMIGPTFAKNRVVVHYREDYTYRKDGSVGPVRRCVGVFVIDGGKIKYWKDYTN